MRAKTALILIILVGLSACSGGDDSPGASGATDPTGTDGQASEDLGAALGAGAGGGTLIFDGTEHPIESVVCQLGDRVDVGTVGEDFRVFVTSSSGGGFDVQVLDPTPVQWFAENDTVEVSGSHLTSDGDTYFNNQTDAKVEASFDIQCP